MKRNILFIASAALLLVSSVRALAATTPSNPGANGYNVAPLINSLVINEGSTRTITLYIQNISHDVEQVRAIVNDFIEAPSNDGTPELLLNGASSNYSLKQFITVPNNSFTLTPGQEESVQVNITIPRNTASGGYFAAVRFSPQSLASGSNVNLSGSVASLILVTVPGNLHQVLNIASLGAGDSKGHIHRLFTSNKDIYGIVYFKNTGNVQLQPFGNFVLRSGKKDLSNIAVNKENGYILPSSVRFYTAKLNGIGSFGKYTIYGNFGFGSRGQLLAASTTFYVIPLWMLWTFLSLVAPLVLISIFYLRYYHRSQK